MPQLCLPALSCQSEVPLPPADELQAREDSENSFQKAKKVCGAYDMDVGALAWMFGLVQEVE